MLFRLLGPLEVTDGDRPVRLGEGRQRGVLVLLLLHRNEAVSSDRLIDALWGESPPPTAAKVLQNYVGQLRRALGDREGRRLETRGRSYALRVEDGELDLDRFERLAHQGGEALEHEQAAEAADWLREALALWRGPPLADVAYEAFAQSEIARLQERRTAALEQRIEADLALGRHADLVAELEVLVAEQPLRERLREQLMLALYRCGRQADALAAYQEARRALLDELGVEPGPALRELQAAILRHDPELAPQPRARPRPARADRPRLALLAAGGALLVAAAVAAALLSTRGGGGAAVDVRADSVAVLDATSGRLVASVPVGVSPKDLAVADGALWVANQQDDTVTKIEVRSRRVVATVSPGIGVDGLAAAAGAVWVADSRTAVARLLDPTFHSVVRSVRLAGAPVTLAALLSPVAVGPDTAWIGNGQGTIVRVDRRGRRVHAVATGNDPSAVAVGAGGVWVADAADGTVTRIDPRTNAIVATIPIAPGATAIAVGAGAVWLANPLEDRVVRIDPATNTPTASVRVDGGPSAVAADEGGVWVAGRRSGMLTRLDPSTAHATKTIDLGHSPQAVALAGGHVWVSVQASPTPVGASSSGRARDAATVLLADGLDTTTDPAIAGLYPIIYYETCALLLNYPDRPGPEGLRIEPEVARAMPAVSDGGRTYTFTLRPGFRFSPPSNAPVTAQAFRHAIERTLHPKTQSYAPTFMGDIVGFDAYRSGRAKHLAGVTADGDVLTIRLRAPSPSLPARLGTIFFCAVPPNTPISSDSVERIPMAGPYHYASQVARRRIVLRRNPNYRGERPRRLREITFVLDMTAARGVGAVEAGRADYISGVPPGAVARLARHYGAHGTETRGGRQRYVSEPRGWLHVLMFNTRRPLFASARLRQAVNHALDRRALAASLPLGLQPGRAGRPTDQFLPSPWPGYRDARIYPLGGPDLATARALAGGRRARVTFYTCNISLCLQSAQQVRRDLGAIGLDVDVRAFPTEELWNRQARPDEPWDLAYLGYGADYTDPSGLIDSLFGPFRGRNGFSLNFGRFEDARLTRRMRAASRLTGPERELAYARLDADFARIGVGAPFAQEMSTDFFSARMGCQVSQPIYGIDVGALCVRE